MRSTRSGAGRPLLTSIILVADSVPLSAAEPYGDCLTYPDGHHEVWTRWQRLGARGLTVRGLPPAIMAYEYDAVPRGRIVFECPARRFVIYADSKLFAAATVARIVHRFGLAQDSWEVRPDAHYRT